MHSATAIFSVLGVLAIILMFQFQFASVVVLTVSTISRNASTGVNSELTNTIPQGPVGPILYYGESPPVPLDNKTSPIPTPITPLNSTAMIEDYFFNEISGLINGTSVTDRCSQCIMGLELMHLAAITQPVQTVTNLLIRACEAIPTIHDTIYAATCYDEFSGIGGLGPFFAQLFSKMSLQTGDMSAFCHFNFHVCDRPPTIEIDESLYFTPKPESANVVPELSGRQLTFSTFLTGILIHATKSAQRPTAVNTYVAGRMPPTRNFTLTEKMLRFQHHALDTCTVTHLPPWPYRHSQACPSSSIRTTSLLQYSLAILCHTTEMTSCPELTSSTRKPLPIEPSKLT